MATYVCKLTLMLSDPPGPYQLDNATMQPRKPNHTGLSMTVGILHMLLTHQHDSETRPVLRRSSKPDEQSLSSWRRSVFSHDSATTLSTPSHDLETCGWVEYTRTDNSVYFHHPTLCVTTDVNMMDPDNMEAVVALLNGSDGDVDLPQKDWELWLRHDETSTHGFFATRAWIHHAERIFSDQCPSKSSEIYIPKDQSLFISLACHFYC
jgi:hypothetical protein